MTKAIVIGAGFGGIAAALRLRHKGYDVEIIDRCPEIGGRAQVYEREGFYHDAGPTVITAPFLFEELFTLFGKNLGDYARLVPLDPWYRYVFPDGRTFDYGGTVEETLAEIGKFNPADRENYLTLLAESKRIFETGYTKLGDQPFHRLSSMLATVPDMIRLRSDRTVWRFVCRHIKDPALRQAFSIQPLLVGGNPFDTTSIYALIHYLEREWGIHFVMGGTGALVQALKTLMQEEGIAIKTGQSVERISVESGKANGVVLSSGETRPADIIISNADAPYLYAAMIDKRDQALSARLKTKQAHYSMGLYVLYFGTRTTYPEIAHHTIWLGTRYKDLLDDIFHKKTLADDFSMYVHRPTATDPSFAPPGCDSFYVLVPVPNLQAEIDWAVEGPALQARIISALERTIMPGLSETIAAPFYKTPEDFRDDYATLHGTGFSIAPLLRQSAWFRYHNKAEGLDNLYLVGAGTHPGAGLPGVLTSAKVIDKLVDDAPMKPKAAAAF